MLFLGDDVSGGRSSDDGTGGCALDVDAPVALGMTVGQLTEQITFLRECGESLPFGGSLVGRVVAALSPLSFVRLVKQAPGVIRFSRTADDVLARHPFMAPLEAWRLAATCARASLHLPSIEAVALSVQARVSTLRALEGGEDGCAVDLDAGQFVAPGIRIRDLVEALTAIKARGGGLFEGEQAGRLFDLLSPVSFVRVLMDDLGMFRVPDCAALLALRFPFLTSPEVAAFASEFAAEKLELPRLHRVIALSRHRVANALRADGANTHDIARRLGVTTRFIRMIAPSGKMASKAGSSKRQAHTRHD